MRIRDAVIDAILGFIVYQLSDWDLRFRQCL
jgi:hypothetical protein